MSIVKGGKRHSSSCSNCASIEMSAPRWKASSDSRLGCISHSTLPPLPMYSIGVCRLRLVDMNAVSVACAPQARRGFAHGDSPGWGAGWGAERSSPRWTGAGAYRDRAELVDDPEAFGQLAADAAVERRRRLLGRGRGGELADGRAQVGHCRREGELRVARDRGAVRAGEVGDLAEEGVDGLEGGP